MQEKKCVTCRFNVPSKNTFVFRATDNLDENKLEEIKRILDKVLSTAIQIDNFSSITEEDLLRRAGFLETEYLQELDYNLKKLSIIYRRKLSEIDIEPYNTVIPKIFKGNMDIQFDTGVYVMLMYSTLHLCKSCDLQANEKGF